MNRNPAARRALGAVLRAFREDCALSQEELGHLADVDRTYVGSVERGERNVSFENLWFLLHALGVSWTQLGRALDREPVFSKPPRTRRKDGTEHVKRPGR